ncbi:hypothetical protein ACERK3_01640 [Phycisphaerales bacterium AB-hyl4]|uniref:Uncharacterized protein n=1 Tax=Natronomicrosphaera hydrolytica TaxID=3242702 RepID=A0ABV4U068_9BACT
MNQRPARIVITDFIHDQLAPERDVRRRLAGVYTGVAFGSLS